MTERHILFDAVNVGRPEDRRFAKRTSAFGTLALHQVALARAAEHDFAGAGNFEAFDHGLFCFNTLGTSHNNFFR
jgi:hypothetical protein